jgi:hypothetical protein
VTGEAEKKADRRYVYFRRREAHFDVRRVDVYPLTVKKQRKTWRVKGQREIRWFTLDEAAEPVQEPGLLGLLRNIAQTGLRQSAIGRLDLRKFE